MNVDDDEAPLLRLQNALMDLDTAVIRASKVEFPDVDFTSPVEEPVAPSLDTAESEEDFLKVWAQNEDARRAEFARRVDDAVGKEMDSTGVAWIPERRRDQIADEVAVQFRKQLRPYV